MRRCDIDSLYKLTTDNGWGMEKSYLECIFNTDPTGLIVVVTDEGEVIGIFVTLQLFYPHHEESCFFAHSAKTKSQIRSADQRLSFRYITTIPILLKSASPMLQPSSVTVAVQPGLHRTWSETLNTGDAVVISI